MKAIKFVRPAALDDHLALGWRHLYTRRAITRQKPAWLWWAGDGPPHHPEVAKLLGDLGPGVARHPNEGLD